MKTAFTALSLLSVSFSASAALPLECLDGSVETFRCEGVESPDNSPEAEIFMTEAVICERGGETSFRIRLGDGDDFSHELPAAVSTDADGMTSYFNEDPNGIASLKIRANVSQSESPNGDFSMIFSERTLTRAVFCQAK